MIYKIRKGKHRGWPFSFAVWLNKKVIKRKVVFYPSCKYTQVKPEDYKDTNKLFGLGYFWDHHIDSARFGWYYSTEFSKIILQAYTYERGERQQTDLAYMDFMKPYKLYLFIDEGVYKFRVYDMIKQILVGTFDVPFAHRKRWSYMLGVYFGGNNPAPHDMKIEMKKL